MEHFQIDEYLRLESIKMSMASIIFETINSERPFLRKWLPFVELTKNQSDTEQFIKSIIRQNRSRRDEIYTIWYKEEFAGLIGFKETDWINRKTELGYWISEKMQGKGIVLFISKAKNESGSD
jgi:ribosomal-protein-serine acetyltransferase